MATKYSDLFHATTLDGTEKVPILQGVGSNSNKFATTAEIAALGAGANAKTRQVVFVADGGGATLTTGYKSQVQIPYSGTIQSVTVLGKNGASGSIVIDLYKTTYANFPPSVSNSITASAKPTISSSTKYTDSTLTGWTKSIAAGDIIAMNIDSVTSFQWIEVVIKVLAD